MKLYGATIIGSILGILLSAIALVTLLVLAGGHASGVSALLLFSLAIGLANGLVACLIRLLFGLKTDSKTTLYLLTGSGTAVVFALVLALATTASGLALLSGALLGMSAGYGSYLLPSQLEQL